MWKRTVDGKTLTFHLAGINNQNFIMRDEQTGSYWQQVSGKAISGPLKGKQLMPVRVDELTFDLWRKESPDASILAPTAQESKYEPENWEEEIQKLPTVISPDKTLPDREHIVGISHNREEKAYPLDRLRQQKVIQDLLGGDPIVVILGPDNRSVRAFLGRSPESGKTVEFFRKTGEAWGLVDSIDGHEWDFRGCRMDTNQVCLKQLDLLHDYWFDWKNYHPKTGIYRH